MKETIIKILLIMLAIAASVVYAWYMKDKGQTEKDDSQKPADKPSKSRFEMTIFDTGKSDSILIEMNGMVILNDTADKDDFEMISRALDSKKIKTIDYLIISHFHKDHIGSAADIIANYEVKSMFMPDYKEDSEFYEDMLKQAKKHDVPITVLHKKKKLDIGGDSIVIYAPHKSKYDDANDFSLITEVNYQQSSMLLMGDALKERTAEFIDDVQLDTKSYQLVKIPHHGAYNKKLNEIFEKTNPKYAVITEDSSLSRTEEKLIKLIEKNNCETIFTYKGAVKISSNGKTVKASQSKL